MKKSVTVTRAGDEYVIVVNKIGDLEKIKRTVGKIGYDCLSAHSKKISG